MQKIETSLENIIAAVMERIPSLLLGLIILIVGSYIIRLLISFIKSRFEKRNVDLSLRDFTISVVRFLLFALLIITCAGAIGIPTTSFIAVLSAMSLAIGLSLQGSLANFSGGVLILLFKPFKVGDSISSSTGATGTVENIDILYTTLRTSDGIAIFSPNGPLANSIITNYSRLSNRRIEYKFDIAIKTDTKLVRRVLLDSLQKDPRVLQSPNPQVIVNQITPSAVQFLVHAWVAKGDYAGAFYDIQETLKESLESNEIAGPQSQNEFHIYNNTNS